MKKAIGIIETKGFPTAIGALDQMLKTANVELIGYKKKLGAGLVTVTIIGDVGAVKAAIVAGENVGNQIGHVVGTHIIPRISDDVAIAFNFSEEAINNITITKSIVPEKKKSELRTECLEKAKSKSSEKTASKPKPKDKGSEKAKKK